MKSENQMVQVIMNRGMFINKVWFITAVAGQVGGGDEWSEVEHQKGVML